MTPHDPLPNVSYQKKCLRRWLLQARRARLWWEVFGLRYSLRRVDRYQQRLRRQAKRQAAKYQQQRELIELVWSEQPARRRGGCTDDFF